MRKFLLVFLFIALSSQVFAEKAVPESAYSFEYREVAKLFVGPEPPFEKDGLLVFSAKEGPRYVGIAFDFENYQIIHPFFLKTTYDENGDKIRSWYFYILEKIPEVKTIHYRMIVDGIWTTDPMNPDQHYDTTTGIRLSKLTLSDNHVSKTRLATNANSSFAHFVYRGQPGQKVRLSGTFTRWDSWIYQLKETEAGVYELDLPLPRGTYYYVYFIGTKCFTDSTNPERAYVKEDSQPVSKIVVE